MGFLLSKQACSHNNIIINFFKLQNSTLSDFNSKLLDKAKMVFPALQNEDLTPFLLNSRAVSAYDAVILLQAISVGSATNLSCLIVSSAC